MEEDSGPPQAASPPRRAVVLTPGPRHARSMGLEADGSGFEQEEEDGSGLFYESTACAALDEGARRSWQAGGDTSEDELMQAVSEDEAREAAVDLRRSPVLLPAPDLFVGAADLLSEHGQDPRQQVLVQPLLPRARDVAVQTLTVLTASTGEGAPRRAGGLW